MYTISNDKRYFGNFIHYITRIKPISPKILKKSGRIDTVNFQK